MSDYQKYRCLACGDILRNSQEDTLINHLRTYHPFINIKDHFAPQHRRQQHYIPCPLPNSPVKGCPQCGPPPPPPPPPHPPCPPPLKPAGPVCGPCGPCPPQPNPPIPQNPPIPCPVPYAVNCPPPTEEEYCRAMQRQQRKLNRTNYKFTVESWKSGATKVVCPCCGSEEQPMIRRQRNEVSDSLLRTIVSFICWPFKVLPFMLWESNVVNLYCGQCNNFLGTYNRKLGCIVDIGANLCNPSY